MIVKITNLEEKIRKKAGKVCGFIDVEQALDFEYAESLGVNINDLIVTQPDNGEEALE